MGQERPRVGLGVYILNDQDELLLLHRTGAHAGNTWCPPGGHLEFGESFEECAVRETKEESGIDIDFVKVLGVLNTLFKDEGRHSVTISMSARVAHGEAHIMEPGKFDDIGWFPLRELPSPLFPSVNEYFKANLDCLCGSEKKYRDCHGK